MISKTLYTIVTNNNLLEILNLEGEKYGVRFTDEDVFIILAKHSDKLNEVFCQPNTNKTANILKEIIEEEIVNRKNGKNIKLDDKQKRTKQFLESAINKES